MGIGGEAMGFRDKVMGMRGEAMNITGMVPGVAQAEERRSQGEEQGSQADEQSSQAKEPRSQAEKRRSQGKEQGFQGGHLRQLLERWVARAWLRPLDRAFADFLWREVPEAPPLLILAAALASHQLGRGHACLDLEASLRDPDFALSLPPEGDQDRPEEAPPRPAQVLAGLSLATWTAALRSCPELVGTQAGMAKARSPSTLPEMSSGHPPGHPPEQPPEQPPSYPHEGPSELPPVIYPLTGLVTSPVTAQNMAPVRPQATPLVLAGPRLYLRRYWEYEQAVGVGITARLAQSAAWQAALPLGPLRQILDRLFPATDQRPDWQKLACALAARSAFSIITGGPGTGKTTTVVRLLALLQGLAFATTPAGQPPRPLRIRLAAPTGKAAARLNEAIAGAVARLPLEDLADGEAVRAAIPVTVTTLHRLLGSRPDTRRLRHHADNPLALEVLVIDEASMIDLEMMAKVLDALPSGARLILLGDKDQLASVEAGAVLGQLCRQAHRGRFTPETRDWLVAATGQTLSPDLIDPSGRPLDQAIVMLRHSHRFATASGIGRLAEVVNAGDSAGVLDIWNRGPADLALIGLRDQEDPALGELVSGAGGYRHYLEVLRQGQPEAEAGDEAFDAWARSVLEAHGQFQVLCALRRGPWGVEGLNVRIAGQLLAAGLIPTASGWYLGRPVLVTRNDYALGLMNGDIGITLARPAQGPGLRGVAGLGEGLGSGMEPGLRAGPGHRAGPGLRADRGLRTESSQVAGLDHRPYSDLRADAGRHQGWIPRVAFPAGDGTKGIKWILPSRLQMVETVYALTVHKSQGSEFTHAALVLPDTLSPILTRELLYTGITRARHRLTLLRPGDGEVLAQAVQRRVLRASGLLEAG